MRTPDQTTDHAPDVPGPITTSSGTNADHSRLISGSRVQGTTVYSPAGEELGQIDDVMIDPTSGRIVYGVLQFGGFMGMGSDYHPIPFARLQYDSAREGYTTDLTKEQLENAPRHDDDWYHDREWQERSHQHYGVSPYWL
ncbi:PRC-barrel domain-containing protein [Pararhodobacter sp. SW119]|uniref:PRC-barrel domain-containing protein n=1 Tax=Pararhodobacter sp. SW119 TaxID=2780075 RepID=UPI001AE0CE9A|nr:PRC-barrel domain-containing protein [Pararhodobacter sp. SW119]